MELYIFFIFFLITVILSWISIKLFYIKKNKRFMESFLDSNSNITILYNDDKIVFINSMGLEFFSFISVDEFNKTYSNLSQLFLSDENCADCVDKHTHGLKWFEKLKEKNGKYFKIRLFSKRDNLNYYFNINLSKIKEKNYYLLTFNDITKLESEKTNITKQAEHDILTNIYNRVKLNEVISTLIYNANRQSIDFSIILLDIDHFKSINDEHGHNIGDKVLVELSRLINMNLRDNDVFARWGGEEFVVVAKSKVKETYLLASRLRKVVNEFPFRKVGKVTCSFGVTEFKIGDTQSLLFDRVDQALYQAKENGRDQVVVK